MSTNFLKKIMDKGNDYVREWDYKWFITTVSTIPNIFYLLLNDIFLFSQNCHSILHLILWMK